MEGNTFTKFVRNRFRVSLNEASKLIVGRHCLEDLFTALFAAHYHGEAGSIGLESSSKSSSSSSTSPSSSSGSPASMMAKLAIGSMLASSSDDDGPASMMAKMAMAGMLAKAATRTRERKRGRRASPSRSASRSRSRQASPATQRSGTPPVDAPQSPVAVTDSSPGPSSGRPGDDSPLPDVSPHVSPVSRPVPVPDAELSITCVVRATLARDLPQWIQSEGSKIRRRRFANANLRMLNWTLSLSGKSLRAPQTDEEWNALSDDPSNAAAFDEICTRIYTKEQRGSIAQMLPPLATTSALFKALRLIADGDNEWRRHSKTGNEHWLCDPVVEQVVANRDKTLSRQEKALLTCIVDPTTIRTTFKDVYIQPATIEALRTVVTLPLIAPDAYSKGILASEAGAGVLLYGPPGTGKTMACRALARESRVRMIQVSASTILRCHVGESEEMVVAIFSLARKLGPCIVFIDELDAIFGCRSEKTPVWHSSVLTEFMQEMDGLKTASVNQQKGVIVVGATNRPQDLDYAVLRRLPRRILVDLPGMIERRKILTHYLRDEQVAPELDINALAVKTTLFSGSDIRHLVLAATLNALKSSLSVSLQETDGLRETVVVSARLITAEHFNLALKEISASCIADMEALDQVRQWARGGGSRRGAKAEVTMQARAPQQREIHLVLPAGAN
ncbi:AAA-domain-containing protein [Auricularia subglabra TFB-10046 SS5]|nr:AAA-domain-containing protein [Auricularia subglabra TFB-10046 SS5]